MRAGQVIDVLDQGSTELVQPGERKLHLGLGAAGADHPAADRALGEMVQQSGLADACLAAQHESGAPTGSYTRHKLIKCSALRAPAKHPYTTVSPTQAPPASIVRLSMSARLAIG